MIKIHLFTSSLFFDITREPKRRRMRSLFNAFHHYLLFRMQYFATERSEGAEFIPVLYTFNNPFYIEDTLLELSFFKRYKNRSIWQLVCTNASYDLTDSGQTEDDKTQ